MRTYTKQVKPNSTGAREKFRSTGAKQIVNKSPVLFNIVPSTNTWLFGDGQTMLFGDGQEIIWA